MFPTSSCSVHSLYSRSRLAIAKLSLGRILVTHLKLPAHELANNQLELRQERRDSSKLKNQYCKKVAKMNFVPRNGCNNKPLNALLCTFHTKSIMTD